jgi:acyl-CoA dehydrogenase
VSRPAANEIRELASKIGAEVAAPAAAEVDRLARFPSEAIDALRDAQLLSAMVPVELGGGGAEIPEIGGVIEALSEHCPSTAMIYAMHQIQVACIVHHGNSDWARAYLADKVAHDALLASATTEMGTGGDVRSSICAVEQEGAHFTLKKNAPVVSYGAHADAILITARRNPDTAAGDQVLVVAPIEQCTLERTIPWNALGFRGTCSDGYMLSVAGDVDQILSDPYADISGRTMLPTSHILWSSVWLGLATSAVDRARAYVRAQVKKNPGVTPPSALRLAELVDTHNQMRALVQREARAYADLQNDEDELTSIGFAVRMNVLKTSASKLVLDIVSKAMLICGMEGYKDEGQFALGRHLRDSYGASLMINNDRVYANTAQMLLIHRGD